MGTTNSCVAIMEGNNTKVIENSEGKLNLIFSSTKYIWLNLKLIQTLKFSKLWKFLVIFESNEILDWTIDFNGLNVKDGCSMIKLFYD